jgi:hypothetical protein
LPRFGRVVMRDYMVCGGIEKRLLVTVSLQF